MRIVFETQPVFLSKHFEYLKRSLLGGWQQNQDPSQSHFKASFSFQPQSTITLSRGNGVVSVKIQQQPALSQAASAKSNLWSEVVNWGLGLLMLGATISLVVMYGPKLYYSVFSPQTVRSELTDEVSAVGGEFAKGASEHSEEIELAAIGSARIDETGNVVERRRYLPEINQNLPTGDWLIISRIGVHSELQATATAKEALETGVWWAPDFGLPGELDYPMIVAGHRYGWKWWWKTDYWTYHSFYRLTELEPGDEIKLISEQREWTYEIYASEEGEEITDYQADLILYTCKFLNSPVRYFEYARLVQLE